MIALGPCQPGSSCWLSRRRFVRYTGPPLRPPNRPSMLFPTVSFAVFFAIVLTVSWLLMPHRTWWKLFLTGASWFFYGCAGWGFVLLLAASTVFNHFMAFNDRPDRGPVPAVVDGGCRRRQPRRPGLVQVRRLPFHQRFQPPQLPGPGHPPSGPEGAAAGRDLLLHLPGHQLRGRRQAPPAASGGAARLRRVSVLLPAPSGRTHRPGFGVPAPDTAAPRSPATWRRAGRCG